MESISSDGVSKSIFSDGLSTYMVVSGISVDVGCFEISMLKNNDISHMLSFEFRQLDAKQMIFFDINGLETLADIIPHMTAESILIFIKNVGELMFELDDYMLAATDLILESKYIYYDEKKSEYRFAYVKGYDQPVAKQLRKLLEDILQNVFHRDKEGLDIVYDLYNMVALDKVDMKEILDYVERHRKNMNKKNMNSGDDLINLDSEIAVCEQKDRQKLMDEVFNNDKEDKEETVERRRLTLDYTGLLKTGIVITGIVGLLLASVQFFGTGHTEYIRALMITVFLMAAEVGIYTGMKRREPIPLLQAGNANVVYSSNGKKADHSENMSAINYNGLMKPNKINSESSLKAEGFAAMIHDRRTSDIGTTILNGGQSDISTTILNEGQSDIGTTVLAASKRQEIYLESLEADGSGDSSIETNIRNHGRIITVGRSNSKCDHVIYDGGVSRRHAELIWRDDWIDVIDLGSTNGTKVNGNELTPGEAVHVKVGDVVSFGDVRYLCRD